MRQRAVSFLALPQRVLTSMFLGVSHCRRFRPGGGSVPVSGSYSSVAEAAARLRYLRGIRLRPHATSVRPALPNLITRIVITFANLLSYMKLSPAEKEIIAQRQQHLRACEQYLKEEFIGIDEIIENMMEYISIWYLMPELLQRPVIINLWGMTGVGKTDLVRKMVKFLGFQDRFAEIELSNSENATWCRSVAEILSKNELADEKPCIVLFDEIQRFSTLDPNGNPIPQTRFSDFWELLSDGKLSRKERDELENSLLNLIYRKKDNEVRRSRGEDVMEHTFLTYWDARDLKKMLVLPEEVEDLTNLSEERVIEIIRQARKNKKIYEPVDHRKMLIIISGNLDEAYQMAGQTGEADVDADIFHAFTKKISLVDIKHALGVKFRPEQVARFGNIHLIYNALRRQDFEALIAKEISRRIQEIKEKYDITLQVSDHIHRLIYRNGVFPVQGVRPVFSALIDVLDANLTRLLFEAILSDADHISLDYDVVQKKIVGIIDEKRIEIPFVGRIDKIRQSNTEDNNASISVHESGHAVAYIVLTGMVPLQLKSKIASSYAGGFTFPHQMNDSLANILKKIKIYLAGGLAEELIFGAENATGGRSADRERATEELQNYIRLYGFDEKFQAAYNLENYPNRMNHQVTDETIEKIMKEQKEETIKLLQIHRPFLIELSKTLAEHGTLQPNEMQDIAAKHGLQTSIREEAHLYIAPYADMLRDSEARPD